MARTGGIPAETERQLTKTFKAFYRLCLLHGATHLYVFATEAMRRASNGGEVMYNLARIGIPINLIDGRREAEFGLRGAWLDCATPSESVLMVEVGGGSAQVALAEVQDGLPVIVEEKSLPLGTGAMIGKLGLTQPADDNQIKELMDFVKSHVAPLFADAPSSAQSMIGVGGVARGLLKALHPDGNPILVKEEIDYLAWATRRLKSEEVGARFNVKLKRASTLLPGAVIYRTILECAEQSQIKVSRFGVREGAILEMAEGRLKAIPL